MDTSGSEAYQHILVRLVRGASAQLLGACRSRTKG